MADYTLNVKANEASAVSTGGLQESGGQDLGMGAIADGQVVKRSGTSLVGDTYTPSEVSGTGVLTGGVLSTGAGATEYSISDGTGIITDQSGNVTNVSWSGKSNITPTNIATSLLTWVAIDSGGNVVEQTSAFTATQARANVVLGVIVHTDNVNVQAVNNEQLPFAQPVNQLYDFAQAIGFVNVSGNVFGPAKFPNEETMFISKTSGVIFKFGSNYDVSTTDPHNKTLAAMDTADATIPAGLGDFPNIFQYRYNNGNSDPLTETEIDPDNLDDGAGGLTPLGNNQWSVQRIYVFVSGNVKIQRGVESFATKAAAIDGIASEAYFTEPSIAANGLFRGWLVVKKSASDLSDTTEAQFISAPKFGEGSVGSTPTPPGDSSAILLTAKKGGIAGTINVAQVVRTTGYSSPDILVELADADAAGEMPAIGVVRETITDAAAGVVVFSGILQGIDASGAGVGESWVIGDALYVGTTPGALTNVKPTAYNEGVQAVARVLSNSATTGVIQVVGAGRVNDAPNSVETLKEVITSPTQTTLGSDGNVLQLTGANSWGVADASAVATAKGLLGIRLANGVVQTRGQWTTTGLDAAEEYYLSETAGAITTTKPTTAGAIVRLIGYALNTTTLILDIDRTYLEN